MDDVELEKRQQEAEEQRMAELRAQGTPVTEQTFAAWKQRFDAELRLQRAQLEPETVSRDKGPSGKIFFQSQEAASMVPVCTASLTSTPRTYPLSADTGLCVCSSSGLRSETKS